MPVKFFFITIKYMEKGLYFQLYSETNPVFILNIYFSSSLIFKRNIQHQLLYKMSLEMFSFLLLKPLLY